MAARLLGREGDQNGRTRDGSKEMLTFAYCALNSENVKSG